MQVHICLCPWVCVRWNREVEINTLSTMRLIAERMPVVAASQRISPEVNDPPHLGATSTW